MTNQALVVGASGIIGSATARLLSDRGSPVTALARHPPAQRGVTPLAADLLQPHSLLPLLDIRPTHVFISTWSRQATEAENIRVNASMLRNLLDILGKADSVKHVALVTGLKHYLGPFEAYGKGSLPETPFREEQERLDVENFSRAGRRGLRSCRPRWLPLERPSSAHGDWPGRGQCDEHGNHARGLRQHLPGNQPPVSLSRLAGAVGKPGRDDRRDAVGKTSALASTTPAAENEAFNVVNGDVFRWSWMWTQLAQWFGINAEPFDGTVRPLEEQMRDDAALWKDIAARHGLAEKDMDRLVSPWHTDADLGRPIEVVTDMSKSRRMGFLDYEPSNDAFFALFKRLRELSLIP